MQLDPTHRWSSSALRLFVLEPDHVGDAYVSWLNDPEVNKYLESRFAAHDVSSTRSFVDGMYHSDHNLMFGIHSAELDRHVGNIKLGPVDAHHRTGEVGIMIGDRAAWGRGLASTAIAMLADIARAEIGLRRLTAGCYASNVGSRRAFERAGFSVEGTRPDHFLMDGATEDLIMMGRML